PVSITGNGFALPQAAVMKPEPGRFHVTLSQQEIRIGTLPMAKLGAGGVTVDTGATPYPGALVTIAQLRAQLDALVGSPTGRIVVIAPKALPARRVLDVVKAAGPHEVVLAVAAGGAPTGWSLPGIVPIVLDAKPDAKRTAWALDVNVDATIAELEVKPASAFEAPRIVIEKDATVAHLATLLGALAFRQATTASLSHAP
ncbi:MAG TPA: hypothetical protein VK427_20555, partial [Kofleriaceae bacterium]|nr:hypothetical protein [Kofleriaceae bacterium]